MGDASDQQTVCSTGWPERQKKNIIGFGMLVSAEIEDGKVEDGNNEYDGNICVWTAGTAWTLCGQ